MSSNIAYRRISNLVSKTESKAIRSLFATFAVALIVLSAAIPLISVGSDAEEYSGERYDVTYLIGDVPINLDSEFNEITPLDSSLTVKYYGVPVAEYNPQFWSGSIVGDAVNPDNWCEIKSYDDGVGELVVFTGWEVNGNTVDPGEDLREYCEDGRVTLNATWGYAKKISLISGGVNRVDASSDKYQNFLILTGDVKFTRNADIGGVTIRSDVTGRFSIDIARYYNVFFTLQDRYLELNGNVIIDNLILNSKAEDANHGNSHALYAKGNLILGTNISGSGDVQVFGGWNGEDNENSDTDLRIFSGTYHNVFGGSWKGHLNSSKITLAGSSDNLTIRDTVYGGNGHDGSGRGRDGLADYNIDVATAIIVGGTVLHDLDPYSLPEYPKNYQSVIGGSQRYGNVGTTNVTLSGTAIAYMVQGGGREGTTSVGTTNVTISGKANVTYMVCGSITNGNNESSPPVDVANVTIKDEAKIGESGHGNQALVLGGGWDVYESARMPSTGSTYVEIQGGLVYGSVYGGGFRGTVGSTSVDISGGHIYGNVFGGGKGGPDPRKSGNDAHGIAKVSDEVSLSLHGSAIIDGSVYGGGEGPDSIVVGGTSDVASVNGNISILIDGCTISGSVYGGGRGASETVTSVNVEGIASVSGDISVSIRSGIIKGSVYGAGEYGRVGSPTEQADISVTIEGIGTIIGGDVFGGGYGEAGRLSANTGARTVTIDGASVNGSVYGGSRLGNDNCSGSGNPTLYSKGTTEVSIFSGDIRSGSSGNVYGGGYKGYSNYDVSIHIGDPNNPGISGEILRVKSVYGGSSVGSYDESSGQTELLIGDTNIYIWSNVDSQGDPIYQDPTIITGDVFGEGDFCSITGKSSIEFHDYVQHDSMMSIQKSDVLKIIGSSLTLKGNIDGSQTEATERLSLNIIGRLVLQEGSRMSDITLLAASSQISGFLSSDENGDSLIPSFDSEGNVVIEDLNRIIIRNGMILSILGKDNSGDTGDGTISGAAFIDSGNSAYYGALLMGMSTAADAGMPEFYVAFGDGTVAANRMDMQYDLGGTERNEVAIWYISGSYKVEKTLVLDEGKESSGVVEEHVIIGLPRLFPGSELSLASAYIFTDSPGSLALVDSLDDAAGGSDLLVLAGVGDHDTHLKFEGGNGFIIKDDGSGSTTNDSGTLLDISFSTNMGFGTTGYIGTLTIHFMELSGNVPVNMFDVEIGIYLRISPEDTQRIEKTIVMRPRSDGSYFGSADVYLPVHEDSISEYRLTNVTGAPQGLSLRTVDTNLGKDGWMDGKYDEAPLPISNGLNVVLGSGGIFSPVIRFEYHSDSVSEFGGPVELSILATDEDGSGETHGYTVIISFENVNLIEIGFMDKILGVEDGEIGWNAPYLLFSAYVEYGASLDNSYVARSSSEIGDSSIAINVKSSQDKAIYLYGDKTTGIVKTVNALDKEDAESYFGRDIGASGYDVLTLRDALYEMIGLKTPVNLPEGDPFEYKNSRFCDSPVYPTQFNFELPVTSDKTIYINYGVIVEIEAFTDDEVDGDYHVEPQSILIGTPGDHVDLSKIGVRVPIGYEVDDEQGGYWYDQSKNPISSSPGGLLFSTYVDTTVYVKLKLLDYSVSISYFDTDDVEISDVSTELRRNGNILVSTMVTYEGLHNGDSISIGFSTDPKYYCIEEITASVSEGGSINVIFTSSKVMGTSHEASFRMPAADISIKIILAESYTVTVTMSGSGTGYPYNDNGNYVPKLADDGTTVNFVEGTIGSISITGLGNEISGPSTIDFVAPNGYTICVVGDNGSKFEYGMDSEFVVDSNGLILTVYLAKERDLSTTVVDEGNEPVADHDPVIFVKRYDPTTSGWAIDYEKLNDERLRVGDLVTITSGSGTTIIGITATGAEKESTEDWTYRVTGAHDPVSFAITIEMNSTREVTVIVIFGDKPLSIPNGAVTMNGSDVESEGIYDSQTGEARYSVTVGNSNFMIGANFEGYTCTGGMIIDDAESTVTIHAIPNLKGVQTNPMVLFAVVHGGVFELIYSENPENGSFSADLGGHPFTVTVSNGTLTVSSFDINGCAGIAFAYLDNGGLLVLMFIPETVGAGAGEVVP